MSDFQDLDEILPVAHSAKRLPVGGEILEFPDRISAESGILLLRVQQQARENPALLEATGAVLVEKVGAERLEALMVEVLGRTFEEMLPLVGMNPARVMHIFQTLTVWHLAGEEAAREFWNDPGKAMALAATRTGPSKGKAKSARRGSRASSPTRASATRAAKGGASSSPTGD